MIRIGINLLPYDAGKHGGAEVYLRNVAEWMVLLRPQWTFALFGRRSTVDAYADIGACERHYVDVPNSRAGRVIVEQLWLPVIARKTRIDCLISNYVAPVAFGGRNLTVIHDMLVMRYPATMERSKVLYWRALLPLSARVSRRVGTVSRFSEQEIVKFLPSAKGKTFVTVEGVRSEFDVEQRGAAPPPSAPRYLIVATFGSHKNLLTAIRAFAAVNAKIPSATLTIVGAARTPDALAYRRVVEGEISKQGLSGCVTITGHISDAELARLYVGATACVLPSLYEGFGLPVIEAQRMSCPVIVADAGSLPEVGGDGVIRVPPLEVDAFADAMLSMLDESVAERLRERGRSNAAQYTWEAAARQMITAIESGFSPRGRGAVEE